jgi:DNA primase
VARIRQEDVEAVKERTDIVQLVGQYLTLKRTGHDSMSGLCPFHQEKSPSFSVSPSKGVFYCFGCGKGGDAITFLRELESLSYVEAIERLAQAAGVQLRFEGDSPADRRAAERRKALYRANEEASRLFRQMLADGREAGDARAYLAERGLTAEAIESFEIGYAPGYPDFLLRRLSPATSHPRSSSRPGSPPAATTGRSATGSGDGSRSRSRISRVDTSGSAPASCPAIHVPVSRRST